MKDYKSFLADTKLPIYYVVDADGIGELEKRVGEYLAAGFKPAGGVSYAKVMPKIPSHVHTVDDRPRAVYMQAVYFLPE